MGIYIKNMEKPDNCGECFFETLDAEYKNGEWATFGHCLAKQIETDDCPLEEIDLVRCGECKRCEERTTLNGLPFLYCLKMEVSVGSDQYCYWGDRRE